MTTSTLHQTVFDSPVGPLTLVASADGVGTKLKVAHMAGRHNTVGQCLINHCTNDILVQGATPLFFLDYLGAAALEPKVFEDVVAGLAKACRENGCALLGGEPAEMPGLYPKGEYDLVGTIVGQVEKKKVITGKSIRKGDVLIGLPSNGLHTNGYSLVNRLIERGDVDLDSTPAGWDETLADALCRPHRSYLAPMMALRDSVDVRAVAHITGGGLQDNLPRVLPDGVGARIDRSSWHPNAVFDWILEKSGMDRDEAYHVFNMGCGLVVIQGDQHGLQPGFLARVVLLVFVGAAYDEQRRRRAGEIVRVALAGVDEQVDRQAAPVEAHGLRARLLCAASERLIRTALAITDQVPVRVLPLTGAPQRALQNHAHQSLLAVAQAQLRSRKALR